jgi:ferredoxin-NADP reductase
MADHFPIELSYSRMLAPSVRHLGFRRADGQPLAFIPGQFLQIHFEKDGAKTKRSYSVASTPGSLDIEIAVSYVPGGAATALLSAIGEGQALEASGPYGRFCLMEADRNARYILIGTGTGITPYRAMLPQIASLIASRGLKVALVQGVRDAGELLYGEEFQAFAQAHPNFEYYPCFSQAPRNSWKGDRAGRVHAVLPELQLDPTADIAYLCGNPNMVDEVFNHFKEAGFAVPTVRREKYVSSK